MHLPNYFCAFSYLFCFFNVRCIHFSSFEDVIQAVVCMKVSSSTWIRSSSALLLFITKHECKTSCLTMSRNKSNARTSDPLFRFCGDSHCDATLERKELESLNIDSLLLLKWFYIQGFANFTTVYIVAKRDSINSSQKSHHYAISIIT